MALTKRSSLDLPEHGADGFHSRSWDEFQDQLEQLKSYELSRGHRAEFFYRGQRDSAWSLETTLERAGVNGQPVHDYYHQISKIQPAIESLRGQRWKTPDWPTVRNSLGEPDEWSLTRFPDPETYSYMLHLRHHSFPSPLLDWSRSPFVAAFFAFSGNIQPRGEGAAIFVYSHSPTGIISGSTSVPQIRNVGSHVRTHKRHVLQQAEYTMCAYHFGHWRFAQHSEALRIVTNSNQNLLWKFTLPWNERVKVLQRLDTYNLNSYSLFDSEESLMQTLAFRVFEADQ